MNIIYRESENKTENMTTP